MLMRRFKLFIAFMLTVMSIYTSCDDEEIDGPDEDICTSPEHLGISEFNEEEGFITFIWSDVINADSFEFTYEELDSADSVLYTETIITADTSATVFFTFDPADTTVTIVASVISICGNATSTPATTTKIKYWNGVAVDDIVMGLVNDPLKNKDCFCGSINSGSSSNCEEFRLMEYGEQFTDETLAPLNFYLLFFYVREDFCGCFTNPDDIGQLINCSKVLDKKYRKDTSNDCENC